jgi:hypothetical protein
MELGHSLTDQNSFAARLLNAPGRAVRDRGIQHELAHWGPREEAGMAFRLGLGESKTVFETAGDSLYRFRVFANQASMHAHSELQLRQAS